MARDANRRRVVRESHIASFRPLLRAGKRVLIPVLGFGAVDISSNLGRETESNAGGHPNDDHVLPRKDS